MNRPGQPSLRIKEMRKRTDVLFLAKLTLPRAAAGAGSVMRKSSICAVSWRSFSRRGRCGVADEVDGWGETAVASVRTDAATVRRCSRVHSQ